MPRQDTVGFVDVNDEVGNSVVDWEDGMRVGFDVGVKVVGGVMGLDVVGWNVGMKVGSDVVVWDVGMEVGSDVDIWYVGDDVSNWDEGEDVGVDVVGCDDVGNDVDGDDVSTNIGHQAQPQILIPVLPHMQLLHAFWVVPPNFSA